MVAPLRTAGPFRVPARRPPPTSLWGVVRAQTQAEAPSASGPGRPLREEGAEATTPALTEMAAVVTDGGTPADGGSPKGGDLMPAADSAPGECFSVEHATACFTTPPFLLCHLTSEFF